MSIPTITALPSPPSISDPANFETEADALLGALPTFVTEMNAFGAAILASYTADNYNSTSTTSVAIGTGSKGPFAVGTGKLYQVGQWILVARTSAPTTTWMLGQVTAYSGGNLTLNINHYLGTGTHTDWTLSLSGPKPGAWATASQVTFSGTSTTISSIPPFDEFRLVIKAASHSGGGTPNLQVELSDDGTNWTGPLVFAPNVASTATLYGDIIVTSTQDGAGGLVSRLANLTSNRTGAVATGTAHGWRVSAALTAMRFSWSGGETFDGGTADPRWR